MADITTNRTVVYDVVKEYPDMYKIYVYKTPYTLPGHVQQQLERKKQEKKDNAELSVHRSIRRTKSVISDLVECNKFDYFCTFTFDPKKINRYDVARCKFKMSMWLSRQRQHSPNFQYLIVPEFHKDGALHFHALIKNFNGRLKDSGKKQKGRTVYNLSGYRSGFSTAVRIDNHVAVSQYVKKYITKDMPLIDSQKRYWCSRGLVRPDTKVNYYSELLQGLNEWSHTAKTFVQKQFAFNSGDPYAAPVKVYENENYDVFQIAKL